MKKILFATFIVLTTILVVSCSDDDISDALGGSCSNEGAETCSEDGSLILVCRDYTWQSKKTCNLNFSQYCRQTASGSYSCTDSGNTTDPTSDSTTEPTTNEPNDNEPTDTEPNDNEPTDTEPNDNEPTDTEPNDNEPTDAETSDNDTDTTPEPEENPIPAPGDCANIITCMDTCDENDTTCQQNCYNNGTTAGKNQFSAWQTCNENNSCNYYYDCLWTKCRDEEAICGLAGDTANYKIPYGKATIQGTFTYLHDENEENILVSNCIEGGFVSGTFGNNANIIDSSKIPLAYAQLISNPDDSTDKRIVLFQGHNDETATTPVVRMLIKATSTGSYVFGLGEFSTEKVRLFVSEKDASCDHAFGYGSVTISAISYTPGSTTITVNGEVDLYSYKAMPYYGGDISDNEYWIACPAK